MKTYFFSLSSVFPMSVYLHLFCKNIYTHNISNHNIYNNIIIKKNSVHQKKNFKHSHIVHISIILESLFKKIYKQNLYEIEIFRNIYSYCQLNEFSIFNFKSIYIVINFFCENMSIFIVFLVGKKYCSDIYN